MEGKSYKPLFDDDDELDDPLASLLTASRERRGPPSPQFSLVNTAIQSGGTSSPAQPIPFDQSPLGQLDRDEGENRPLLARAPGYGAINQPAPRAAPPRQIGSTLTDNALDAITINTPGPQTGAFGATNALANLGSNPASHPILPGNATHWGQTGLAATTGTGVADVLGMARSGHQFVRAAMKDTQPGTLAHDMRRSAMKRGALDFTTNAADLVGQQIPSAISTGTSLAGHVAAPVLSTVGGAFGIGVNAVVGARSAYRTKRAVGHAIAMHRALKHPTVTGASQPVQDAAKFQRSQMGWRAGRAGIGAVGAGLGIAGGATLLALGLSNPIGWGLLGAGAAVAAGLGAWKLGRWAYKKIRGRLGKDRDEHAGTLVDAVKNPDPNHADRVGAEHILREREIDPAKVRNASDEDAREHLKDRFAAW
jgi:hypothetical protein